MPLDFPDDDHPLTGISTPTEWNFQCICRNELHTYDLQKCQIKTEWLDFKWRLSSRPLDQQMKELSHLSTIYPGTFEIMFGDRFLFRSVQDCFNRISCLESQLYHADSTIVALDKKLISAVQGGFPVCRHLFELYCMKDSKDGMPNWTLWSVRETVRCVLTGIGGWLNCILTLTPVELLLAFTIGIKENPNIRVSDLPPLRHLQGQPSDSVQAIFLSGPAWNFSLEYLYKLTLGLIAIKPSIDTLRNTPSLHQIHDILLLKIRNVVEKLNEGHRLYFNSPPTLPTAEWDLLPQDMKRRIQQFARNETDGTIEQKIGYIEQLLPVPEASPPAEPEPSPSTPPEHTSRRRRFLRKFRRRKKGDG